MSGVINTGSNITIRSGTIFKKVATIAEVHKRNFKSADKAPCS